jgi:AAA family ATP:ADP antiporter
LGREAKYKSKPFLDAAVYRGGDLLSGWLYTGFIALGMSIGAIALTAAPVAGIWTLLAIKLGSKQEDLAKSAVEAK